MAKDPKSLPTSSVNSAAVSSNLGFPELDWSPALPQEEIPCEAGECVGKGCEKRGTRS